MTEIFLGDLPATNCLQHNWQVPRKLIEVRIGRQDPQAVPDGHRADEQISAGSLDAVSPADLVVGCGILIILGIQRKVWVIAKILFELFKTPLGLRAG